MVIGGPPPIREIVWGDGGGIRGDAECREVGRRIGLVMARVVNALEREQGQI
jgi:hypothetical protein